MPDALRADAPAVAEAVAHSPAITAPIFAWAEPLPRRRGKLKPLTGMCEVFLLARLPHRWEPPTVVRSLGQTTTPLFHVARLFVDKRAPETPITILRPGMAPLTGTVGGAAFNTLVAGDRAYLGAAGGWAE